MLVMSEMLCYVMFNPQVKVARSCPTLCDPTSCLDQESCSSTAGQKCAVSQQAVLKVAVCQRSVSHSGQSVIVTSVVSTELTT